MKEEKTRIRDEVLIARKTACVPLDIPMRDIPASRVFDIRAYRERDWVLIFMDKETFESLKKLCEKRGLDVRKVIYGSIIKTKELMQEGEENDKVENGKKE